jgi:hypothetical protein
MSVADSAGRSRLSTGLRALGPKWMILEANQEIRKSFSAIGMCAILFAKNNPAGF